MSSILKILRRIGGAKVTPTAGDEGQLAIWKADKTATGAASLFFHDGNQWVELLDTQGRKVTQPVVSSETAPATPFVGEFWFKPSTKALSVWDGAAWANVAFTNVSNTFTMSQVIEVTDTKPALRVTQKGTGASLLVEDEANPDGTPFVVDASGHIGIGIAAPVSQLHIDSGAINGYARLTNDKSGKTASDGFELAFDGTDAYVNNKETGDIRFLTANVERLRLDPYGKVGIGGVTPLVPVHVKSTQTGAEIARFDAPNGGFLTFYNGATRLGYLQSTNLSTELLSTTATPLNLGTNGITVMRLTSNKEVLINTLSNTVGGAAHALAYKFPGGGAQYGMGFFPGIDNTTAITFANASNSTVGSVAVTPTATAFNTSSDYRLKEDIQPVSNPVARLNALKPVNFAWKSNGTRVDGFIAHEVQAVIPEAVTGEKDAVNDEGNPMYQGIDQSKLVPLLVAALQDALKRIEALEARP